MGILITTDHYGWMARRKLVYEIFLSCRATLEKEFCLLSFSIQFSKITYGGDCIGRNCWKPILTNE